MTMGMRKTLKKGSNSNNIIVKISKIMKKGEKVIINDTI